MQRCWYGSLLESPKSDIPDHRSYVNRLRHALRNVSKSGSDVEARARRSRQRDAMDFILLTRPGRGHELKIIQHTLERLQYALEIIQLALEKVQLAIGRLQFTLEIMQLAMECVQPGLKIIQLAVTGHISAVGWWTF